MSLHKLKAFWENASGVFSYVCMLVTSFMAIGISLFVLSMRAAIARIMNRDGNSPNELSETTASANPNISARKVKRVHIYYGTQTGTSQMMAEQLYHELLVKVKDDILVNLSCLSRLEVESLVDVQKFPDADSSFCIFFISTYVDGCPPETCSWFFKSKFYSHFLLKHSS